MALATPDLPAVAVDSLRPTRPRCAALADRHRGRRPGRPTTTGQPVLLTSGTTGTPKGARRERAAAAIPAASAGLLSARPLPASATSSCIPAPLFHAWGSRQSILAGALG